MKHTLVSDILDVTINHFGAELSSVKTKAGLEFMWQAKKEIWPRHAPVLFPIVGKLKENTFLFKDRSYSLGQHGFARDHSFELIQQTPSSCMFELRSGSKSKENYPFDFIFRITYRLEQNVLTTRYTVINAGKEPLFFSVGAHPAFKCPLIESERFEDYYLEFESSSYKLAELNNGLRKDPSSGGKRELSLENKRLRLSNTLFDNDALVFENAQIDTISLGSDTPGHKITMTCENWPYFGIWSKKDCTEFVCLEPWYGIADSETTSQELSQKEGILKLEAENTFNCSFSVTFG